jgi:hypothetical protein
MPTPRKPQVMARVVLIGMPPKVDPMMMGAGAASSA